jgi:hypothetical protein
MPAGEYRFNGESQAIRIQSKDAKHVATVLPRTIAAKLSGGEVKLIFDIARSVLSSPGVVG